MSRLCLHSSRTRRVRTLNVRWWYSIYELCMLVTECCSEFRIRSWTWRGTLEWAGGGNPHWWPSSSSRRSPWRGGSSSPSGLRVCTSSYVFDLSLSRVLEMIRSCCIASFAILVGSYDVSPPLLSCNGLSFPFEVILSDWVFKDLRTLDVCLAVLICGDNGISRDPLDVCFRDQLAGSAHEPMHRGWHTFLTLW